jgi:hypothetical protein
VNLDFFADQAVLKRKGRTIPRDESKSMASAVESGISHKAGSLFFVMKKVRMQSSHPISRTAQVSHEMIMKKI